VAGYTLLLSRDGSAGPTPTRETPVETAETPVVSPTGLQARSGVRITQLAITGAGGLIDLRFQVVDPDLAANVHGTATPPMLFDERSGVVVDQLFMGHQHHGRMRAGQSYYLLFDNPGNLVHRGTRVTVQLGNSRVAHIRVQ